MIPIFNSDKNQLTSLKGEVSSFYEILPPDMEGMNNSNVERMINDLEQAIINTNGEFKFYKIDHKFYINQFGDIDLPHAKLIEKDNPLSLLVSDEDIEINYYDNYYTQGNHYYRLLSFSTFPASIETHDVLRWPDFVLNIRKIDKLKAKQKIDLQRKLHFSSLFKSLRDFNSENAFEQAEAVLEGVNRDEVALFDCECYLILKAQSKLELDDMTDEVIYSFRGRNSKLIVEERGLSYFHKCSLPGVKPSFKRNIVTPSDYLVELIPFSRDYIHNSGMKLSARSGNDLSFDLFEQSSINFNVLITGASGQGKSMLANKILQYELSQNTKALVLDLGNSFLKNTKYHDGVMLSQKINPLQYRDARYLKEFILAGIEEKMGKKEQGILFETIKEILEKDHIKNFSQFLAELELTFKGVSYYFSEIMEYFDSEIRPLSQLTYCDFSLYPEAMKAPLIIYLIESFKQIEGKKIFIFDECWHLLNNNADYIAECFRTFRKHQASAIAISQNLDDFSSTQLGRVIIQNTYYKFLFRQSLRMSEYLDQDKIDLLNTIQSSKGEYSEALLISDTIQKPVRYYPTPLEYELFTTDRAELNQFDSYLKSGGVHIDFKRAMENFTLLKHPTWSQTNETN